MKNKKKSLHFFIIVMSVILGVCFISCGDDEKDEIGEETSSSIIGTWWNSWGNDAASYTAYSFFDDGTGLMFDKGNGAERFTYIYNAQAKIVSVEYSEYNKEQMTVSKLTPTALVMDGDEYKKNRTYL